MYMHNAIMSCTLYIYIYKVCIFYLYIILFASYTSIRASLVALVVQNLPTNDGNARDTGLIPGLGRSPTVRNGNPLHYSCLKNVMDRGAWWATVHRITKASDTTEHTHTYFNKAEKNICLLTIKEARNGVM